MIHGTDGVSSRPLSHSLSLAHWPADEKRGGAYYIMDRPGIARAYLRSWFLTDFISVLPLDLVLILIKGQSSLKVPPCV